MDHLGRVISRRTTYSPFLSSQSKKLASSTSKAILQYFVPIAIE
jgi:hypothetical protein